MREVDFSKTIRRKVPAQDVDLTAQTAGADTPPAYSFTPPEQTQVETQADDQPKQSDYSYFSELTKQFTEPPLSKEEVEKRNRGAAAAQAVAGLGNAINAFSNLAYAGEAPSQTLPKLPEVNYQQLEDRAREQRNQYNTMLYRGKAADYDAYQKALAQWNARQMQKAELNRKLENDRKGELKWGYEQQYKADRDKVKDEQNQRDFGLKQQQLGLKQQELAETKDYHSKSGGNGKKRTDYHSISIKGDRGYSRDYDMNDDAEVLRAWGEYKKAGMYKPAPDEKEPDTPEKIRTYLLTRLGVRDEADSSKLQYRVPTWGEE